MDLLTLDNLFTLLMLIALQAVLGFDNLLYISLESKRAPAPDAPSIEELQPLFPGLELIKGIGKLESDPMRMDEDLDSSWEVLAEAIQTVMRRYSVPEPYEKLKALTRGQAVTRDRLHEFIGTLEIPDAEKDRLLAMTPSSYIGCAESLAREVSTDLTETGRFLNPRD